MNWRRINIAGILVFVGIFVAWEIAWLLGLLQLEFLPAPHEIIAAMFELFANGELAEAVLHTVGVVIQAWAIAVIIGTIAGVALGRFRLLEWTFGSTVDVLRSLPIVAFVPAVLLVFGLTRDAEVFVAIYAAIWPMLVSVAGGMHHIDPRLGDVARTFRLSPLAATWKITLPAMLPSVLVGARLSLGIALVLVVVTEMIGNPAGLGYGLVKWQYALRPEAMWAYLIIIGLLGLVLNEILVRVARFVPASRKARA